jgi:hypothetical protein
MATSPRTSDFYKKAWGVFLAIIFFWILTPVVTALLIRWFGLNDLQTHGQIGDLFGSINTLFSGLALFGVVVAIYLQWRDLQEQRKETKDLQEIQRETANSLRDAMYATSFSKIYDILDDKSIIDARYAVYELEEVHYSEWREKEDWPEIERHIRTLLRAYNIAGIYVKHHFLLEKHIVPDWEPSLRKTWSILKPYVRERRIDRTMGPSGSGNHWQNYEQLAALADEWHTTQRNMPKSSVI